MEKKFAKTLSGYKKIGIIGLGITGKAAYNFFKNAGIPTKCWDEFENVRNNFAKLYPGAEMSSFDTWSDCSHIVVSPGIPLFYPKTHQVVKFATKHNITLTSDVEILHDFIKVRAKILAVTGTNGKSTTTALIAHILKSSGINALEGGNLGTSALSLPLDKDVYVLELSSYQLEILESFRANIAIFLNLTPDHLERHGNIENYTKAKLKIFQNQDASDYSIVGVDNPITAWVFEEQKTRASKTIGISYNSELKSAKNVISYENNILHDNFWAQEERIKDNIYLLGKHNRENICAAYAACKAFGVDAREIIAHIATFKGLPHRMQYIGKIREISFYNDSKSTNADSARPALESLQNIFWLAGGIPKAGGIHSLKDCLSTVKKAYLFGRAATDFARTLEGEVQFEIFQNLESAFDRAFSDARNDSGTEKSILLSPACSSLDQYENFEKRGNHFAELYQTKKQENK
ncbi:MAG: UDP-N-acetylmuramoyl-L-alanine--D-glutamate ligase [Rickettsiaceae bacterium]|nr:UDP-N-acetylmuramoyl-L-alanine--D-glutamate ligase [Rickettsiaceae bacterium]